jgi:hypothetical protein
VPFLYNAFGIEMAAQTLSTSPPTGWMCWKRYLIVLKGHQLLQPGAQLNARCSAATGAGADGWARCWLGWRLICSGWI